MIHISLSTVLYVIQLSAERGDTETGGEITERDTETFQNSINIAFNNASDSDS